MRFFKNEKLRVNQTKKRISNIENGPCPDYPADIEYEKYWTKLTIEQGSPEGVKTDIVWAFMDRKRCDTCNIKDNGIMLIKEDGRGLLRMGPHRFMAWIAKNILIKYGRHDG